MVTLSGAAKTAGIIGWPVAHSLSPRLHGYWLDKHGIDGAYVPLAVAPEHIEQALKNLPRLGFAGANVTVPHKEAALAAADELSDAAKKIGAVNTLVCRHDGTLFGDNTDGVGFIENLKAGAPNWRAENGPAVVLGAGGAARAVVVSLLGAGVTEVRLANRSIDRAEALAADIDGNVRVLSWPDRAQAIDGAGLLVNTTTLGMAGKPALDVDLDGLAGDAVVTDIVYAPLMTPLLTDAQSRGLNVVDGLGMLLHQARPGFAAWFGVMPDIDDGLRRHVLAGLS